METGGTSPSSSPRCNSDFYALRAGFHSDTGEQLLLS
jgi:hypothetical protein